MKLFFLPYETLVSTLRNIYFNFVKQIMKNNILFILPIIFNNINPNYYRNIDEYRKFEDSIFLHNFVSKRNRMSSQINFSSILLENAVNELARLPGIGRRTALRLALHLLRQEEKDVEVLGNAVINLRARINYCRVCHNISDTDVCLICSNPRRDGKTVCVVETVRDVMAIENTQQFKGLYHVLGGVISPMDGIVPADLEIESLIERVKNEGIQEIILALSATMEGDTTNFYIYRKIENLPVKITTISRGVAIGDGLEYTDEITLGRSILNRIEFNMKNN